MNDQQLRIAVNGKSFSSQTKGGAIRASLNIVNSLHQRYCEQGTPNKLEILIPSNRIFSHQEIGVYESVSLKFFINPLFANTYFKNIWEQIHLPLFLRKNQSYQLLLNLTNSAPSLLPLSLSQVLLIHDAGFLNREWFDPIFSRYLKWILLQSQKRNIQLVTVSQFSAKDLLTYFPNINPPKVIFNGYDSPPKSINKNPYEFDYILFIGSINPRKNLANLIHAYNLLKHRLGTGLKLVIIGSKKQIFKAGDISSDADSDILFTGYVDDPTKWSILEGAKCLVFPSFLEGFGLPILEAFSVGTPVVASDIPVFRELFKDAIEYVDPFLPDSIAQGIQNVLINPTYQEDLVRKGHEIKNGFSWSQAAQSYDVLLQKILS
ncbi:MAG: glycosyltransferase family 1 protein [Thermosynechococcaceae cyanobacterium]